MSDATSDVEGGETEPVLDGLEPTIEDVDRVEGGREAVLVRCDYCRGVGILRQSRHGEVDLHVDPFPQLHDAPPRSQPPAPTAPSTPDSTVDDAPAHPTLREQLDALYEEHG